MRQVAEQVTANVIFNTKKVLTSEEAAKYMGISLSYLYRLTSEMKIPHSKPTGKMVYFDREELEQWLMSCRIATSGEINQRAQTYCMQKGGKQ